MAHHAHADKTTDRNLKEEISHLQNLVSEIEVAMLTSVGTDGEMRSCPMMTQELDKNGDIWFLTGEHGSRVHDIQQNQWVNLSFGLKEKNRFLSVSGKASVVKDAEKVRKYWKPDYKVWFPKGVEDPEISLIKIHIDNAEYWDGPKLGTSPAKIKAEAEHGTIHRAS